LLSLSGKINPPRVYEVHMYFDGNYSREAGKSIETT
jgi:hypothetical protein